MPEEVAVVGFDDVEPASIVRPALTMIGDLLADRDAAERQCVGGVELVVRDSTP